MPILFLLFLFIALPLLELYVLIQVGSEIGAFTTIALSILTAVIGMTLVRYQGLGVLMRVHGQIDRGEVPALEMLDGALLLIAGLFLLLPGLLTDSVGFLLLVSPLRRWLIARGVRITPTVNTANTDQEGPRVIEGDYRRED